MINWFKTLFRLVRDYRALARRYTTDLQGLYEQLTPVEATATQALADAATALKTAQAAHKLIYDRTTVHFDISPTRHDPNVVIVVGRYQDKDFVQVYSFSIDEFRGLVDNMREAARHGAIGRVDAPPTLRAVIDRDFKF